MPLTSEIKQWFIKPMPGMNTKLEDLEQDVQYVKLAQNTRYEEEPGTAYKRQPITYYNTSTLGANPIMSITRYYKSDGTIKLIAVYDTTIKVGTDATGVFTSLTLPVGFSLTAGKRMSFVVDRDLLIMSNGSDNIIAYDGTSDNICWELGSCKAKVGSGTGITRTNISYQITMETDTYICGAVSNEIASVTNEDIELSNIPLGPVGTTNRRVYRKSSETGGSYKLIATIANNTDTTYTDTTADASGGGVLPAVTDDFPKGSILKVHRERFFISGDPNNPNRVYYSEPYLPWYIRQTTNLDYMEIEKDDGDKITGIPIFMGTMQCIKRNTIRKLHITTPVSGADPSTWYADDPVAFTGCPAQWTITETPFGIIFLGWDHWYSWNGAQLTPIIDEFSIEDILITDYNDTVAHFSKGVLLWAYTDSEEGNLYHDRIGRWNFFRNKLSIDKFEGKGINCFASYDGADEAGDVYYGDSINGFVYRSENVPQWIRWNKKSQLDIATVDDVVVGGTEDDPWFEIGWDITIDELTLANIADPATQPAWLTATDYLLGDVVQNGATYYVCILAHTSGAGSEPGVGGSWATYWSLDATAIDIDSLPGTCAMEDTGGTITFPSMNINAGSLLRMYWNQDNYHDSDTVAFHIRTGATQATCEVAAWSAGYTNPNGDDISGETANVWIQIKAELTANSTAGSPRVYFADGFVQKLSYRIGGTVAENSIEFIYDTGNRNYNEPFADKIHKKLICVHDGNTGDGTFSIDWRTENSNGTFNIDMAVNPKRWESFYPSTAMGRDLSLRIYKNDLLDLKIKELKGLYTSEPIIV